MPVPKPRNTDGERDAIKAGKSADAIWPDEPAKTAQKGTDARWTLKIDEKARCRTDGTPANSVIGHRRQSNAAPDLPKH